MANGRELRRRPAQFFPSESRVLLALWVGVWCALSPGGAWAAFNQDILIFRPLENAPKRVTQPDIVFEVEVSAFDPIQRVTINGEVQRISPATWVAIRKNVHLTPGENTFRVEAATASEMSEKTFAIFLQGPGAETGGETPRPFSLMAVVGLETASNVQKLPDSATDIPGGTRAYVIAVPRYDLRVGDAGRVRFRAIVSRDAYGDDALALEEIAFTQLTVAYLRDLGEREYWGVGAGMNTIYQGFGSLAQGETKAEDNTLLFGTLRRSLGGENAYLVMLELKQRNLPGEPDPADPVAVAADEDGTVATLRGAVEMAFGTWRARFRGGYARFDADGENERKTVVRLGADARYPVGKLQLGAGLQLRQTDFSATSDASGTLPRETLTTLQAGVSYPFEKQWLATFALKADTQASNYSDREFDNSGVNASLVYLY